MIRVMLLILMLFPLPVLATKETEERLVKLGDTMRYGLPALGLGIALTREDWKGSTEWAISQGSTLAVTGLTKEVFNQSRWGVRPNHGDKSFPSGHTSAACAGAGFIARRYGTSYGVPALSMAALTAYSRVDSHKHYWRDVIGGCALGLVITGLLVTQEDSNNPTVGLQFSIPLGK